VNVLNAERERFKSMGEEEQFLVVVAAAESFWTDG